MKDNNNQNDKYAIQVNYCCSKDKDQSLMQKRYLNKNNYPITKHKNQEKITNAGNKLKITQHRKQYIEDNNNIIPSTNKDFYDEFLESIQIKKSISNNTHHKLNHLHYYHSHQFQNHSSNSSSSNKLQAQVKSQPNPQLYSKDSYSSVGIEFKNIKKINVVDRKNNFKSPSLSIVKDDKDHAKKRSMNLINNFNRIPLDSNSVFQRNKITFDSFKNKDMSNGNNKIKRQSNDDQRNLFMIQPLKKNPSFDNIQLGFTPKKRIKIQTDQLMIMQNQGKTEESKQKVEDSLKPKQNPKQSIEIKKQVNKKKLLFCCIPRKDIG